MSEPGPAQTFFRYRVTPRMRKRGRQFNPRRIIPRATIPPAVDVTKKVETGKDV